MPSIYDKQIADNSKRIADALEVIAQCLSKNNSR